MICTQLAQAGQNVADSLYKELVGKLYLLPEDCASLFSTTQDFESSQKFSIQLRVASLSNGWGGHYCLLACQTGEGAATSPTALSPKAAFFILELVVDWVGVGAK